ncbi:8-oxoguanine DNA-glycosylase [Cavenderia fasciculata]|uniref:DNA-(apurinic or apyrimidinic site) lyase n=1 Tax=Cavenderia fasciculata TaxID=261658 RepID=F4PN46_CACFS|nr:8-oxoguanine DNA-glycosylase [Cavenderia fasciculata]EGG23736.1 8-oxoguanine DNA-glycosylase [Cavenderia fasciculata]|eukprot:XP_004361587.1 8-oxoguanine DNA-glycosylase [Cavenderia fasciculata]
MLLPVWDRAERVVSSLFKERNHCVKNETGLGRMCDDDDHHNHCNDRLMINVLNRSLRYYSTTVSRTTTTTSHLKVSFIMSQKEQEQEQWESIELINNTLNLRKTLLSGQSFVWRRTKPSASAADQDINTDNERWLGVIGKHAVQLQRRDTYLDYQFIDSNNRINFNNTSIGPDERRSIINDYFNLKYHLPLLFETWSNGETKETNESKEDKENEQDEEEEDKDASLHSLNKEFIRVSPSFIGLRLLRQYPLDCLFSFICSQNNNITRITKMVNSLCETYGDHITTFQGHRLCSFPTLEQLLTIKESSLNDLGFGYRSKFIVKAAQQVKEKGGLQWLQSLRTSNHEHSHKELISLMGVGQKVADCVCLFSLDKFDIVPIDTHIWTISKKHFPSLKNKSLTQKVYQDIRVLWKDRFGDHTGWAHTILFANSIKSNKVKDNVKVKDKKVEKRKDKEENEEEDIEEEEEEEELKRDKKKKK